MTTLKSKKSKASRRTTKIKALVKQQPEPAQGLYRPTSTYGVLFREGNKGYIAKADLIKRVAKATGKSEKVVGFAFSVVSLRNHKSNGGRSTALVEGDKVKLVAIAKKRSPE